MPRAGWESSTTTRAGDEQLRVLTLWRRTALQTYIAPCEAIVGNDPKVFSVQLPARTTTTFGSAALGARSTAPVPLIGPRPSCCAPVLERNTMRDTFDCFAAVMNVAPMHSGHARHFGSVI